MNWSCSRTLVCLLVLSDLSTYFILFGHCCLTFSPPWFSSVFGYFASSLVLFLPPCSFFLIFPGFFLSGRLLNFHVFLNSFLSLFLFYTISLGFSIYSCGFNYYLDLHISPRSLFFLSCRSVIPAIYRTSPPTSTC